MRAECTVKGSRTFRDFVSPEGIDGGGGSEDGDCCVSVSSREGEVLVKVRTGKAILLFLVHFKHLASGL